MVVLRLCFLEICLVAPRQLHDIQLSKVQVLLNNEKGILANSLDYEIKFN